MIFAFQVLPTIIFIAALFAILYYFGVMQFVVRLFAWGMRKVMKASGAETLNVAASIFMGQTEAPLTIRPYLPKMTQSELMTVMTSGMAHISGGIMAAYILFGIEAKHLLTAVIMTAPGTLMMAKMFVPETERARDDGHREARRGTDRRERDRRGGAGDRRGPAPGAERGAMLISFLCAGRAGATRMLGLAGLSLQQILGLGVRAGGVGDGRAVARRGDDRQPARHAHGAQRVRGLLAARARSRRRSTRIPSPSRPSRCAGSRISAPSASRSAASARSRPTGGTTWPASGCGRCWRARWPTS